MNRIATNHGNQCCCSSGRMNGSGELLSKNCQCNSKRADPYTFSTKNLIKNLAQRDNKFTFVDISPTLLRPDLSFYPGLWKNDDLHLNQAGYDRWTAWIRPTLGLK